MVPQRQAQRLDPIQKLNVTNVQPIIPLTKGLYGIHDKGICLLAAVQA